MDKPGIRQIGRYQLTEVIGQGGMGIVYKALDASIGRTVAIKMLRGAYADDPDLLARFHREVRFTAGLQHKNIITVFALDEFEGAPCMVMEYLEGQSIADIIKARQPVPLYEKLGLICQVCDGLQYAHQQNVIHRDIKPANVLVLKDGLAKIVDFGIARISRGETLTRTGLVVGSLQYMSPEQLNGATVDGRTDIYSTGVMLFEFLTGELPFKVAGHDQQATISKILNDSPPPLSRYPGNFPAGLEEILQRALAKNAEARYQTAEDLGYELARLQEGLKRDMVQELLARAKQSVERKDWEPARQQLQELLKFERRNSAANELLVVVRQELLQQQKSAQIDQLRSQAQIACAGRQFEEALECIAQAVRLAPENQELVAFSASIQQQIARAHELAEALQKGYAALSAGELETAAAAAQAALGIDENHTEARALFSLIRKEAEERNRRQQLQQLLEDARSKISAHDYLSALQSLQTAQGIDPADSNIRELINWAARGHAEEKLRKEVQESTRNIGRLLDEGKHADALAACQAALTRFPQESSILKLQQIALRQIDLLARRHFVEQTGEEARRLTETHEGAQAVALVEEALRSYPGDQSLEMLLSLTRAEAERRQQEKNERARQEAAPGDRVAGDDALDQRMLLLQEFQSALARKSSLSQLRAMAERLSAGARQHPFRGAELEQYSAALAAFERYSAEWREDCNRLDTIARTLRDGKPATGGGDLIDRARSISEKYARDEEIRERFKVIRQLAEGLRAGREAAVANLSGIVRSMHSEQRLAVLLSLDKQLRAECASWLEDERVSDLLKEASVRLQEAQQAQARLLQELTHLGESLAAATSTGQIRMLEEQANIVSADSDDAEVNDALNRLRVAARTRRQQLELLQTRLKDLAVQVATARTLTEAEQHSAAALQLASPEAGAEETTDQIRRMQHSVEERKKEYRRITSSLQMLITHCAQAPGPADLDLILARRRDLLKKYPQEQYFRAFEQQLEAAVNDRRRHLAAEQQVLEEAAADEGPPVDPEATIISNRASPAVAERPFREAQPREKRRYIWLTIPAAIFAAATILLILPKSVTIQTAPADASLTVDEHACGSPCSLRLRWGQHQLVAKRPGFADLHRLVEVPLFGGGLPPFALTKLLPSSPPGTESAVGAQPVEAATPTETAPPATGVLSSSNVRLRVHTSTPGALVFLDGSSTPVGETDKSGSYELNSSAGLHRIRVEKAGFEKVPLRTIRVGDHGETIASFDMKAIATTSGSTGPAAQIADNHVPVQDHGPEPPAITAVAADTFILVQAPSGAEIQIDQQVVGHSTGGPFKARVQPGQRAVGVFLAGYQSFSRNLSLNPGDQMPLVANLTPTPVPTVAASLPATHTSSGITDDDRRQIQQLLDRYADGYSQKNLKQIQSLWPSIPTDTVKQIKEFFRNSKSVNMKIRLSDATPAGKRVTIDCSQTLQYSLDGKQSVHTTSMTIYVLRGDAGWQIDFIPLS